MPVEPQPSDVALNGLDIFRILGGRIGVVESQMADPTRGVICYAEVQADRFRMTDMEVAIWLGGKACNDMTTVLASCAIGSHDVADKVRRASWFRHERRVTPLWKRNE